jgi:hypothetical protein
VRKKVTVALPHFLGLMPGPFINDALVDVLRDTVRHKRVTEDVPAAQLLPLAGGDGALEVIADLVSG